jgi:flagellar L-ring protein FlgH
MECTMAKRQWLAVPLLLFPVILIGCAPKNARVDDPTGVQALIAAAKAQAGQTTSGEGSIYADSGRRSDLFRDFKARDVNDIVTIRVAETTQATSSADASNSKDSAATAGFDHLFGLEKKINELPTLVGGKANSTFEGKGSTSRSSTLLTLLSARVIDVLPSGYLVVEGVREVRVNNENQSIYITGVIRPEDISRDNVIPSSAVAQMSVRVQGRGIVSQPLKPGWLYKILNGIMPF